VLSFPENNDCVAMLFFAMGCGLSTSWAVSYSSLDGSDLMLYANGLSRDIHWASQRQSMQQTNKLIATLA